MAAIDITAVAVQAALVAGILALAGTLISVLSTWLIRIFDRATKRNDWILEKRARDAEEIILSLDRFLKIVSELGRELRSILLRLEITLMKQLAYQRKDSNLLHFLEPNFLTDLEDHRKGLSLLLKRTSDEWNSLSTWFYLDSVRLSTWFEDSVNTRRKLSILGITYSEVSMKLNGYTSDLLRICHEIQSNVTTLSEKEREAILSKRKEMEELNAKHVELIAETEKTQKMLIAEFRFRGLLERIKGPMSFIGELHDMLRPK